MPLYSGGTWAARAKGVLHRHLVASFLLKIITILHMVIHFESITFLLTALAKHLKRNCAVVFM